jgi:hypothetical protein
MVRVGAAMKKNRFTRTTRHMAPRSSYSDGPVYLTGGVPSPTFVHRLGWRASSLEKLDYDSATLAACIADAPDVAFYCDNSIFDDRSSPDLWESLFGSTTDVLVTPRIEAELRPWLDARPGHAVDTALTDGRLRVQSGTEWSEAERQAFVHYVNLLATRKRMMSWAELDFERRHGRTPAEADADVLRALVQRSLGERGTLFAKKGAQEKAKRGAISYADEELVYVAVAEALRTGRETIILTKDEDLLDQFYRLIYLLDSHYRSMYIAKAYLADIGSFRMHPVPSSGEWADAMVPASSVLVERADDLPQRVLPAEFHFVPVSCWLIGERYQCLTFGAETEMSSLLEVKGRTRGKNTDILGHRNCHLLVHFMPPPAKGVPPCFAIAEDRTLELGGQHIPAIEANQAIGAVERFKQPVYTPLHVPGSRP